MMEEEKELTLEELQDVIANKNIARLVEIFNEYEEIDIAEVASKLEKIEDLIFIFRVVKSEYTAELFANLPNDIQEELVTAMSNSDVIKLVEASYSDDMADFLEEMPANLVAKVLANASAETRNDINILLNYKDHTAGSIMTTEFISLNSNLTVEEAMTIIREKGRDAETVYTIFCRDNKRNFEGTVDLDDLIFANPGTKLKEILNTDYVSVNVNDDQEEVAQMFKRYDLNAMAVLNNDQKLVGLITIDDVVDVIDEEVNEDISIQSGVVPLKDSYLGTGVFKIALKYIPWIIVLLVLGTFSSMVLSRFEEAFQAVPVLAAFIPVLMDTGGNAGSQTSTVVVRAIALDEINKGDGKKAIWKEFISSIIVGTIISIFSFCWFLFEMGTGIVKISSGANMYEVSGLVSLTLWFTIVLAKLIGCCLPLFAKKLHKDPALMASPFVTTFVDVCSLLIYFFICMFVFRMI